VVHQLKCRQPTFGRYDDPPQPDAVGGFRRTARVVPGQKRRRGRTPAVACCRPDGPGHAAARRPCRGREEPSVIPRSVTVTKRLRHFPFPGDLPGRILVLYHLAGTFAEEAARTVHVSQHREATERVVRIRSPHTDARVHEPTICPCHLRYLARGSRLPPGGRYRERPLIASE